LDKSPDAFRTISEVADHLDTPAHVLRFWESRFPQIRPVKRAGGRRYYRPTDVALLMGIRRLLHDEGMTIRGVQKVLREHGVRHVASLGGGDVLPELEAEASDALPETPVEAAVRAVMAPPAAPQDAPPPAPPAAAPSPAPDLPLFAAPSEPEEEEEEQEPQPEPEPTATFAARLRAISPAALRSRAAKLAPAVARLEALRDRLAERGRVPRR
jgi:DNA-binding transcriptional MerR regulator